MKKRKISKGSRKKHQYYLETIYRKKKVNQNYFFTVTVPKSKRAGIAADPLLTNPLNSDTKLQIGAT